MSFTGLRTDNPALPNFLILGIIYTRTPIKMLRYTFCIVLFLFSQFQHLAFAFGIVARNVPNRLERVLDYQMDSAFLPEKQQILADYFTIRSLKLFQGQSHKF